MLPHASHKNAAFISLGLAAFLTFMSLCMRYAVTGVAAFTLLETCIIIVIISLLSSVVLSKMTQDTRRAKNAGVQLQLDKIQLALQNYAKANYKLPLPADGTLQRDVSSSFGTAVASTATANFYVSSGTVGGILPVRTLAPYGLSDNDAFDEWGNAFGYFVSYRATETNGFIKYKTTTIGDITVRDGSGNNRTTTAIALVLSYGAYGHGSYQASGTRKMAYITNTDALENCECTASAVATTFDNIFVIKQQTASTSTTDIYDMVGRYYNADAFAAPYADSTPDPAPDPTPDATPDPVPR